jgi:hypothetical protein
MKPTQLSKAHSWVMPVFTLLLGIWLVVWVVLMALSAIMTGFVILLGCAVYTFTMYIIEAAHQRKR